MAVVALSSSSPSDASNSPPATPQDPTSVPASDSAATAPPAPSKPSNPNPNPPLQLNPAPLLVAPPPPPAAPSFRPLVAPPPVLQYSSIPKPGFHVVAQPPGVSAAAVPIMPPGAVPPGGVYPAGTPWQPMSSVQMAYGQVPNGYQAFPNRIPPQGPMGMMMPPPGIPRYPNAAMFRPGFPPRTFPSAGPMAQVSRPLIPGVRGVPSVPFVIRPISPVVPPVEKPQTTVYVGKIAPTVDNDFLLSVLKLCGPVKSWKRAQDPSDGTPKGFGFCEFESSEGVLRSLRLLSKLSIDGQELVLNINQATKEYLQRYVEKKSQSESLKEAESGGTDNDIGCTADAEELNKAVAEETKKYSEESGGKQNQENNDRFDIVTEEDHEADRNALDKLTVMLEDRIRNKPLLPPLPVQATADVHGRSNSEVPSKPKDGDSDVNITKTEEKINDGTSCENKEATENDKPEVSSPDRGRRHDSRNKERTRERDVKREKERELEKAERERERERLWKDRERELKIKEAERFYKEHMKDWEAREREKEHQRKIEKEREKERERERRRDISRQEDEMENDDDDSRRRWWRSDMIEDKKRKRKREKDDDCDDRLKEEEEIAEAERRTVEAQSTKDELKSPFDVTVETAKFVSPEELRYAEDGPAISNHDYKIASTNDDNFRNENCRNINSNDENIIITSDVKLGNIAPARKFGFGLIGLGKRTPVPSVFHDEDENVDEKKMRPLVPIDYSTEELQAVQTNDSVAQANFVAAAEFAKHIAGVNLREEKVEMDKERNRHSGERSNQRNPDRNDGDNIRSRDSLEKIHRSSRQKGQEDKPKTENRKLLDAKQLIDTIPKTKEELFVYEVNWEVYDKHNLHERMKPWISKKIIEFLGDEEETLVEYIVTSTKEHVPASEMLEILQAIFEDEVEMFVLKMWRMLIFEIKKVEGGLSGKAKF